jgi:hypothetical protein
MFHAAGSGSVRRFFFHSEDGVSFHDDEGTLLPDVAAARIEAARVLGQLVNERPGDVWQDDLFRLVVTDDLGAILFVLDLTALDAPAAPRRGPRSG